MRFTLPEPRMVAEAREQIRWKRRLSRPAELVIETLVFVLVFLVSFLVLEGVLTTIGMIPVILTDEEVISAIMGAAIEGDGAIDPAQSMELTSRIMQIPAVTIVALFATAGMIAGVIIYCRAIERRRLATLGFRRGHALREYLVGALIGLGLFSLAVLICVLTGTLGYDGLAFGSAGILVLFLIGFLVQGLSEEMVCRGYFMVSLARRQSLAVAVLVSSCAFGALHLFNSNVQALAIVNIILFGCFEGVYLLKRGDIWGAAAIHSLWNFAQGNIYGIPVSGMEKMQSVFAFTPLPGGELISGGAFGIEGGLAATVVLLVALVIALLLKSRDPAPQPLPTPNGAAPVMVIPGAQPLPPPPPRTHPQTLPPPAPETRVPPPPPTTY